MCVLKVDGSKNNVNSIRVVILARKRRGTKRIEEKMKRQVDKEWDGNIEWDTGLW